MRLLVSRPAFRPVSPTWTNRGRMQAVASCSDIMRGASIVNDLTAKHDDGISIIEKRPVVEVVLVAKIHQAEYHLFSAAYAGIQKAVQMGGIHAKFAAKAIVIAAALQFHQFHHLLFTKSGVHNFHLNSMHFTLAQNNW